MTQEARHEGKPQVPEALIAEAREKAKKSNQPFFVSTAPFEGEKRLPWAIYLTQEAEEEDRNFPLLFRGFVTKEDADKTLDFMMQAYQAGRMSVQRDIEKILK